MNIATNVDNRQCVRAWRERPYRETLALRDGREITLRPAHYSDADALQSFFTALSTQSRRQRFHGAVNLVPNPMLRALTTQVSRRHVALVALADLDCGSASLVAEARYAADDSLPGRAEIALSVADAWHCQGLGRALLRRLTMHATNEGLAALDGFVRADNEPMLGLLRGMGARFSSQGPLVRATLTL